MMRGTPTITTEQMLRLTLAEASRYAPGDPDREWRLRAAYRFAAMIAASLDETRTADEVMRDAMTYPGCTHQAA